MNTEINTATVSVTMSCLRHDHDGWALECHDGGQMWREELGIPSDWVLVARRKLVAGSPATMGKWRLTFVSQELAKKARRRVEDFLRKCSGESLWNMANAMYAETGKQVFWPLNDGTEDEY